MATETLDEMALRRETFVPGTPVMLADGQEWHLRCPVLHFEPHESDSGFRACVTLDPGDDFQQLVDAWHGTFNDEGEASGVDIVGTELKIGQRLLLANYDLTPKQVASLLHFAYDPDRNPTASAIRTAVMEVAMGNGPKP